MSNSVNNVLIENFVCYDPYPAKNAFQMQAMVEEMQHDAKWTGTPKLPCVITNITYTNVHIKAGSADKVCNAGTTGYNQCNCAPACAKGSALPHGMPNVLQGYTHDGLVTGIHFNNVTIAGVSVKDMLSGAAPGYLNVTLDYVTHVYVDGEEMIGGRPSLSDGANLASNCAEWARSNFCVNPLYKSFMEQNCKASCNEGAAGCTTKAGSPWDDEKCIAWCGDQTLCDKGKTKNRCPSRCASNCDCNEFNIKNG